MNNSSNKNSSDNTYSMDFTPDEKTENRAPSTTPSTRQQRAPLNEEERRRIAAARAAGMRMNGNSAVVPANNSYRGNPGQVPDNGQIGQYRRPNPNYNGNGQYRRPNPNQPPRRPSQNQPRPESFTGRRRKRKIRINAGAVIFILLIAVVVGVSAYQIVRTPNTIENNSVTLAGTLNENGEAAGKVSIESGEADTSDTVEANESAISYDTISVQNSTIDEGDLVLVNYNYAYDKIDDVVLKNAYTERTGAIKVATTTLGMVPEAFDALEMLVAGLVEDTGCDDLLLSSGHRTLADQQRIWDSNMAAYGEEYTKTYVAVPGYSEHHTGLACDLGFYTDDGASIPLVDHEFGSWISEHCTEYGYILRYPADKADITGIGHEQWHFRYVGLAHAYAIDTLDMCLEEYIDALRLYTADTKMLHIGTDRTVEDLEASGLADVSGGWLTYYIPASSGETTEISVPSGEKFADYEISGNNVDGFIVTITLG